MKFGYVVHIGRPFLHKKFQVSSSKSDTAIVKKPFLQCLLWFDTYCSVREGQKCTKIGWAVVQLSLKTPWKFYQIISKNAGDIKVFANHIKQEVKGTHHYTMLIKQ